MLNRSLSAAVALLVLLVGAVTAADGPPQPPEQRLPAAPALPVEEDLDDQVDLLCVAGDRPLFVRIHLRVDDRSFRSRWRDFGNRLFRALDANADGLLTGDELTKIPSPDLLLEGNARGAAQGVRSVEQTMDLAPIDGVITPEEFHRYLHDKGGRAISLTAVGPGDQGRGGNSYSAGGSEPQLLFSRLDADNDRKLTADELLSALTVLGRIDFDNDGTISLAELRFGRVMTNYFVAPAAGPARVSRPAQFVELSEGETAEAVARQLLDRYDRAPETPAGASANDRLDRGELVQADDLFARLDRNADGELDFDELTQIVAVPEPALTLMVRVGLRNPRQPAVEVLAQAPSQAIEIETTPFGTLTVRLAGLLLEFAAAPDAGARQGTAFFQGQFRAADGDNNKYVDRAESLRIFPFNQLFDSIDSDGDGKLFEREVLDYVGSREAAAASRSLGNVADEERNLFEILDQNRDARIGPRELRQGARRFRQWDSDGDGRIAESEVPRFFRLSFGPGQPSIPGLVGFTPFGPPRPPLPPGGHGGPHWFARMDRNRDGEVSRREFLGPRERFERFDTNSDGAIDAAEATAARQ